MQPPTAFNPPTWDVQASHGPALICLLLLLRSGQPADGLARRGARRIAAAAGGEGGRRRRGCACCGAKRASDGLAKSGAAHWMWFPVWATALSWAAAGRLDGSSGGGAHLQLARQAAVAPARAPPAAAGPLGSPFCLGRAKLAKLLEGPRHPTGAPADSLCCLKSAAADADSCRGLPGGEGKHSRKMPPPRQRRRDTPHLVQVP